MEQNYFTSYLQDYLRSDFPERLAQFNNEEIASLVSEKANHAAVVFEQQRLAGKDVLQAQEFALNQLVGGWPFSTYSFLNELLETEFHADYQRLTQLGKREAFLLKICPLLDKLVQKHELDTGEDQRFCYHLLISQLENLIQTHGI